MHPQSEHLEPIHLCPSVVCCHSGLKDLRGCSLPAPRGWEPPAWGGPTSSHHELGFGGSLPLRETHFVPFFCPPEKVQAEIEQVLVPGCLPTCNDRKNMPYTNAVIHEVQRFVTLLPHVPRCTSVATHFKGYFIPKVLATFQMKRGVQHTSDPLGKVSQGVGELEAQGFWWGRASSLSPISSKSRPMAV